MADTRPSPIATLTLNPAVDATYEVAQLVRDQKSHAHAARYDAGGNGINIGRALKTLGADATCFCVLGGDIGELFERLALPQLDRLDIEWVDGETRVNVTVQERATGSQYQINAVGPALPAEQLDALTARFIAAIGDGIGVLTGSVPPGVGPDIYGELASRIRDAGGRAVVDTFGALLQYAIPASPFLIKPNRYELEQLCGQSLPALGDVAAQARALQRGGIEYVCVSLGAEGALLCGPDNSWHARAPRVVINSSVGAGDSMVAGLVYALAQQQAPAAALRLGIACGTGTTQHPGTALFTNEEAQALLAQVEVAALDI